MLLEVVDLRTLPVPSASANRFECLIVVLGSLIPT